MDGNELLKPIARARHCRACGKSVLDLFVMNRSEKARVNHDLSASDVCARLFKQRNRRLFLFENQPITVATRWQFHIRSIMWIVAASAAALGVVRAVTITSKPPALAKPVIPATSALAKVSRFKGAPRLRGDFWLAKPHETPSVRGPGSEAYR